MFKCNINYFFKYLREMKRICVRRNNNVTEGVSRRFREGVWLISQVNSKSEKALVSHPAMNILRENRLIVTRSLSSKCWEMLQHRQWRIQGILIFTPNWGPKEKEIKFCLSYPSSSKPSKLDCRVWWNPKEMGLGSSWGGIWVLWVMRVFPPYRRRGTKLFHMLFNV